MEPKKIRYFDEDFNEQEAEVIERNGSLRYVEREDGECEYISDFQEI